MTDPALAIGLSAMANCSREPVDEALLVAILRTGDGPGHLVRAVFEDCAYETLLRMGQVAGMSPADIRASYRVARRRHAAANAEMTDPDPPPSC